MSRSRGEICASGRRRSAKAACSGQKVRAFFEARIEHLTIADRVRVECLGKMPDGSQLQPRRPNRRARAVADRGSEAIFATRELRRVWAR
jgi:hypothetical protein